MQLLEDIAAEVPLQGKVFVMDQHRSHISRDVVGFLQGEGAITLFTPPGASEFNPIERVWSWIKYRWRQRVILCPDKLHAGLGWMEEQIDAICKEAAEEEGLIERFATSHFPVIRSVLDQMIQAHQ